MTEKEEKTIEQEFQIALDNIVSKIKGETATAIVCSEQSMILLFRKLMFRLKKQDIQIYKLREQLQNISDEFLKYDWKNSTNEQIYNSLKSLYESIFMNKTDIGKER